MKPMLLPREMPDLDKITYPVYVTPKLDGIRCLIDKGVALSRTLKPIPNKHIQAWAKQWARELQGADGELIVGEPTSSTVYRDTNSFVMSHDKVGDFTFFILDKWDIPNLIFYTRELVKKLSIVPFAINVHSEEASGKDDVLFLEMSYINMNYEGIVLRNPKGIYKYGRCTLKENNSFKLKRFVDDEAVIIGFEEEMHNGNEAGTNELGGTKRSSCKSGLTGKGSLGAFVCQTSDKVEFSVGTGFTQQDRLDFWNNKEALMGSYLKYKYFPVGVKEKPRHPVFLGFRDSIDM